jgi:hypothetical protein
MAINRRDFLHAFAALGVMPIATLARAGEPAPAFIAARLERDERFSVAVLDHMGQLLFSEELDGRAHDIAISPDKTTAVAFARRPGRFALVIDLTGRRKTAAFSAAPGRHFYGHGFFSADGRLLYATENDYENERGVLGIYDPAQNYARVGEFDTYGVGPHEALLMRDGRTIAVGNGGVITHPDLDRVKLNLATMQPSLTYIDARTGDLIDRVQLPASLHQLSMRHLIEANDGTLWFGCQYEGEETDHVPLIGTHKAGGDAVLVAAPEMAYAGMRQYIGAVAINASGSRVAATSPVGGHVLVFDTATRALVDTRAIREVCGIAGDGSDFLAGDAGGHIWRGTTMISAFPDVMWDNHVRRIT